MFPFRPSRAATALLELAEAMLAPDALEQAPDVGGRIDDGAHDAARTLDAAPHPHRRDLPSERRPLEHRRRPAPPQPEQGCIAPLTRGARTREPLRS